MGGDVVDKWIVTDGALVVLIIGSVIADFWLGWTLSVDFHRYRARRRRRRRQPLPPPPPPMLPSRPAGPPSIASTYLDGGTRKRTRVVRRERN